jgi:hypothetical protein
MIFIYIYIAVGVGFSIAAWLEAKSKDKNSKFFTILDSATAIIFTMFWPIIAIDCYINDVAKNNSEDGCDMKTPPK